MEYVDGEPLIPSFTIRGCTHGAGILTSTRVQEDISAKETQPSLTRSNTV
jgi:hypothetical protein